MGDKQLKEDFRKKTEKQPDKYYATSVLKAEGFARKRCSCGKYFWSINGDKCGDPSCTGKFGFIDKTPAKNKLDYIEVWKQFSKFFAKRGYEPIKRYPVAARWRDDTDFVQASIYDFQPYVVSGEISPPANPLVVPQFCLRFNDIDNVGITGAHYTGFVMIGQHAFMPPKDWSQEKYFTDIHGWLKQGIGLKNDDITYHEDAWAGGGNVGPCMEFFSRGLELGNQVYMQYEVTPSGLKELNLKVLDMGMGQERNAWFCTGHSTSYESTFPDVLKKLRSITGVKTENELQKKFLPYASCLNIDEVDDINKAWKDVAKKTGVDVKELKEKVTNLAALYSVAEHSRSVLVALSDGVLPSNVAGGYNLRVILRRALSFIEKNKWDVELADVCKWHAAYLKPQFPELSENLEDVEKILKVEKRKFLETKKRSKGIITSIITKDVTEQKLLQLYDSHGISPEEVAEKANEIGKKIAVPENFYAQVAELQEKKEQKTATKKVEKVDLKGVPETKVLYFEDYTKKEFSAKIIKIVDKMVVLDQTAFYPTSGGQENDTGKIAGKDVVGVFKQGNVVVHVVPDNKFKENEKVDCKIDSERRKQLAQHHTATHIINGSARKLLGNHIWQAGAAKFIDKARLDITHFDQLSTEQVKELEKMSNDNVKKNMKVNSYFMDRGEAEKKYGFRLYQGGVVPGKKLRIIEIKDFDVEACGGTHLNSTSETGTIKILKTSKVQDGIVRIEFAAGKAAEKTDEEKGGILEETAKILGCEIDQIPGRAVELFDKWKTIVKKKKQADPKLISTVKFNGDILAKTAEIFRTQPQHIPKTAQRFLDDIKKCQEP